MFVVNDGWNIKVVAAIRYKSGKSDFNSCLKFFVKSQVFNPFLKFNE